MQRILIIGCGGAGKSTLALQIHEITNLPLIHLDQHYWLPNWTESTKKNWEKKVKQLVQQKSWIMDGNYGGSLHIRIPAADTIIFLNRSRWLCLRRVLSRWWKYRGKTRPDMPKNCPERLSLEFLLYVFSYQETRKPGILKKLSTLTSSHNIFILNNQKEINHFLNELNPSK